MSSDSDDETGYGKPPKRTRWKKGQSGNRKPGHRKRQENTVELIDKLLLKLVEITIGETSRKVTTLEAILYRLWAKEVTGDPRALKIRMKYQEFARQFAKPKFEIVFVDNEYTTAFAAVPLKKGKDDER
jgi:hypothetical protein